MDTFNQRNVEFRIVGDKMKKIIFALIFLLMLALPVSAIITPLPVTGQVTASGEPLSGVSVEIQNIRTGEIVKTTTDSNGFYMVEWANTELKYGAGDEFKITVYDESVTRTAGIDIVANFELKFIPEMCPPCECKECETCEECIPEPCESETDISKILQYFGLGALIGGAGVGIKISKSAKTGKISANVTQHKHKNYDYYHSIYTMHRKNPHKKGEINPKYNSSGTYLG